MARDFEKDSSEFLSVSAAAVTAVPLTMSAWFKHESHPGFFDFLMLLALDDASATPGEHNFLMSVVYSTSTTQKILARASQSGSGTATTTTTTTPGVWGHACAVFSANNSRAAYLNGGGKGTNSTSATPSGIDRTRIGRAPTAFGSVYFDGIIGEVAIWNVALSDAEVAALARGCPATRIRPGNLKGYWLPPWSASPERDYSSSKNHMTVTGTVAASGPPKVRPPFGHDFEDERSFIFVPPPISPDPATMVVSSVAPTVVLGSITVTPNVATQSKSSINPTVVNPVTLSPDPASQSKVSVGPTIVNNVTLTPDVVTASKVSVVPTVLNPVTFTPDPASQSKISLNPTVIQSSVTVTPAAADQVVTVVDPTVLNATTIVPDPADMRVSVEGPTVINGVTVVPTAADLVALTVNPSVVQSSLSITPSASDMRKVSVDPTVVLGAISLTGLIASMRKVVFGPTRAFAYHIQERDAFVAGQVESEVFRSGPVEHDVFTSGGVEQEASVS